LIDGLARPAEAVSLVGAVRPHRPHRRAAIRLEGLTKLYGRFWPWTLDLDVPQGELFGFRGRTAPGSDDAPDDRRHPQPTSGTVAIAGGYPSEPRAAKAKLGFIPDRPYVYEKLTGAEFLRFSRRCMGRTARRWAASR
jgi:ABC-2 type transport system ATP-binding protein